MQNNHFHMFYFLKIKFYLFFFFIHLTLTKMARTKKAIQTEIKKSDLIQ